MITHLHSRLNISLCDPQGNIHHNNLNGEGTSKYVGLCICLKSRGKKLGIVLDYLAKTIKEIGMTSKVEREREIDVF